MNVEIGRENFIILLWKLMSTHNFISMNTYIYLVLTGPSFAVYFIWFDHTANPFGFI
jgi:hypothetical protein